jgi:AmiR/NasT family two-component response regulator
MSYRETEHLRVLIANERKDRLALVAPIVVGLGHEVIAREIDVEDVGPATARERPDVALVGLGESSEHALTLIDKIVREAACPVIVLLHARDPEFINEASKRGVFATSATPMSRTGRARSTSCFDASPSTRISRGHSGAAP